MKFLFVILVVVLVLAITVEGQKYSQRRRRSKEIEDRITKLDDGTKKRIHAMKASGMPPEAIAEKISYTAGGKNVAKRIVEAIQDEPAVKKKAQAPQKATKTPNRDTGKSKTNIKTDNLSKKPDTRTKPTTRTPTKFPARDRREL